MKTNKSDLVQNQKQNIIHIPIYVLYTCFLLAITPARSQSVVEVKASSSAIDIVYNNVIRLSSGVAQIENQNLQTTVSSTTSGGFMFGSEAASSTVYIKKSPKANVIGIYLVNKGLKEIKANEYQGVFFSAIPGYKTGVTFYRYKPWNSWTKPEPIHDIKELNAWDNQCFYWQYDDGVYGLAIPLSDDGYRTTLGQTNGAFGSKAVSYVDGFKSDSIPAMAIGFGTNLYTLLTDVYTHAATWMKKPDNVIARKKFPEPLEYIGWCTWNASEQGSKLNEQTIVQGVESFAKNKFPLGWVLIDDGWFDQRGSRLRSLKPDPKKFPQGFSPMIEKLKRDYHIKHVGFWQALNGYWNGIDLQSPLGMKYQQEMFSWKQRERVDDDTSPQVTYHFIKPTSDSLKTFYSQWHAYLKDEGFTFLKVDNQLVVERMSVNNYPIGLLSKTMHAALNESAKHYFNNAMINCMDMTSDAFYNFGSTPVARSVEDYFPYESGESYNLQRGNAAAHVLQGVYNNLYFSQMVFPDLDMFQSHNPNAEFHAIARAINNGPIYVTDNVGEQNFDLLNQLVLSDGRILRADKPLLPSPECLFQVQDKKLFKAFSESNGIGLLGVWNCADADSVTGSVSSKDVQVQGKKFAFYERFSNTLTITNEKDAIPVSLKRLGYQLYYVANLDQNVAPLGLLNKYNAPAAMDHFTITKVALNVIVKDGGKFGAVLQKKPKDVFVDGARAKKYTFTNGLFSIDIPTDQPIKNHEINIVL